MRAFHSNEGRIAIATNAGWNAMDADVPHGVRHGRGRQRRVGLAPQWQVPRLRVDDPASDGDTKASLTGASTQEPVNTIAQGMPMLWLIPWRLRLRAFYPCT